MTRDVPVCVAILVTTIIVLAGVMTRPERARCPALHDLRTGVQPSGWFSCWPSPAGDPLYDGIRGFPERSIQSPALITGRIYCTGGMRPVVRDFRTVGCQR